MLTIAGKIMRLGNVAILIATVAAVFLGPATGVPTKQQPIPSIFGSKEIKATSLKKFQNRTERSRPILSSSRTI
jgi:hypothetical protein